MFIKLDEKDCFKLNDVKELQNTKIIIGNENICSICGKDFKYSKRNYKCLDYDGRASPLKEVKLNTSHTSCRELINDIEKKKGELLDLEFNLFLKKYK